MFSHKAVFTSEHLQIHMRTFIACENLLLRQEFSNLRIYVLFSIFINDLDEGVQGTLVKFADDTKLGRIANTLEDRNKIQNGLDRLLGYYLSWLHTQSCVFHCVISRSTV